MAAGPVLDRYARYKAGTKKLIQWLATTARRYGDLTKAIPGLSSSTSNATIKVPTRQLVTFAKIIASSSEKVDGVEEILLIAKDVVEGRQVCADWYAMLDTKELETQNESHQHFIEVLRQVNDTLKCKCARQKKTNKATGKAPTRGESETTSSSELRNLFSMLEVEEPSTTPLGTTGPAKKNGRVADGGPCFELEDTGEEKLFAIWCLLKDMAEMREFVRGI